MLVEDIVSAVEQVFVSLEQRHVRLHHLGAQLRKGVGRLPAQNGLGLAGVAHQQLNFRGPEVARIHSDQCLSRLFVYAGFLDAFALPLQ